ncbi:MAG: hypothetical protein ACO24H_10435 [Polynucleobacter sp.]
MSATTNAIIAEADDLVSLAEANPHYVNLTSDERFWYRMAMLDVCNMLINDLMPCEDVDIDSVGSCVDAIAEWHKQLFTLNKHLPKQ